jgi:murein DD-endopeptidase MepM/ murein hydrolase activator NlpD
MSLHQRIVEGTGSATVPSRLLEAMDGVPSAAGLAIARFPGGARAVLVVDADGEAFVAAEQVALERLRGVRRLFRDLAVDLVCVPASEAETIDMPPGMDVYRYTGGARQRLSESALMLPPRAPHRRMCETGLPTRLVSHVTALSLLVVASMASLAPAGSAGGDASDFGFLVSAVRGADASPAPDTPLGPVPTGSTDGFALQAEEVAFLDHGAPAKAPSSVAPKPTPVPVDPGATPIPAPTSAVVWPVPGGSVSQYFHAGHLAVDIAAPYGSQVIAAHDATVTWAGWRDDGGGYVVFLDHGNGMQTRYNHLGGIWVWPGQYVTAGQGIGSVGCSGICTGPHVHFVVTVNGVIDNPLRYLP